MKKGILFIAGVGVFFYGCAMFTSWQAIPPPGGCDQCHKVKISHNWEVTYSAVVLSDERGEEPWQKSTAMLPKEESPLEQQKVTEQRCFRCHRGPDKAHVEYKGRYHH